MGIPDLVPFWGPQTSNLNFCEEDYAVTRYIAEFINTLTNLVYVIYAIHGMRKLRGKPQAGLRSAPYWGLVGVGVCSAAYHTTLKYHTQMSDELSMHLATFPVLYRVLTFETSSQYTRLVGIVLLVIFTAVMVIHMIMDEFILHALTFAISIHLIRTRTLRLISVRITDPVIKRKVRAMTIFAGLIFGFGYAVWLIEHWTCGILIDARHAIGVPWAFFLELHGWWHICTGIGAYIFITAIDFLMSDDIDKDPVGRFAWPGPLVARSMFAGTSEPKRD